MTTKYQKYSIETIKRSDINFAYYNPRTIKENAQKKLKSKIKEDGLVMPLVYNKRTGNLVSGHQRLTIIDGLEKNQDYDITVSVIDVDEKKEVELNVFLNNISSMGTFDPDKIEMLINEFELDRNDLIDSFGFEPTKKTSQEMKDYKNKFVTQQKEKDMNDGESIYGEKADYMFTLVFSSNKEKREFLNKIKIPEFEKLCKYAEIKHIIKDEYKT